jgi:hypothetical protein
MILNLVDGRNEYPYIIMNMIDIDYCEGIINYDKWTKAVFYDGKNINFMIAIINIYVINVREFMYLGVKLELLLRVEMLIAAFLILVSVR